MEISTEIYHWLFPERSRLEQRGSVIIVGEQLVYIINGEFICRLYEDEQVYFDLNPWEYLFLQCRALHIPVKSQIVQGVLEKDCEYIQKMIRFLFKNKHILWSDKIFLIHDTTQEHPAVNQTLQEQLWKIQHGYQDITYSNDAFLLAQFLVSKYSECFQVSITRASECLAVRTQDHRTLNPDESANQRWILLLQQNAQMMAELLRKHSRNLASDINTVLSILAPDLYSPDALELFSALQFYTRFCSSLNRIPDMHKLLWKWFAGGSGVGIWALIHGFTVATNGEYESSDLEDILFQFWRIFCPEPFFRRFFMGCLREILILDQNFGSNSRITRQDIYDMICSLMHRMKIDLATRYLVGETLLRPLLDLLMLLGDNEYCLIEVDRVAAQKALLFILGDLGGACSKLPNIGEIFQHLSRGLRYADTELQIEIGAGMLCIAQDFPESHIKALAIRTLTFSYMENLDDVIFRDFLRPFISNLVVYDAGSLIEPLLKHFSILHISQWTQGDVDIITKLIYNKYATDAFLKTCCDIVLKLTVESNYWALVMSPCLLALAERMCGSPIFTNRITDFLYENMENKLLIRFVYGTLVQSGSLSRGEFSRMMELVRQMKQAQKDEISEKLSILYLNQNEEFEGGEVPPPLLSPELTKTLPIVFGSQGIRRLLQTRQNKKPETIPETETPGKPEIPATVLALKKRTPKALKPIKDVQLDQYSFAPWTGFINNVFEHYSKTVLKKNGEYKSGVSLADWNRFIEESNVFPLVMKNKTTSNGIFKRIALDLISDPETFMDIWCSTFNQVDKWEDKLGAENSETNLQNISMGIMSLVSFSLLNSGNPELVKICKKLPMVEDSYHKYISKSMLHKLGFVVKQTDGEDGIDEVVSVKTRESIVKMVDYKPKPKVVREPSPRVLIETVEEDDDDYHDGEEVHVELTTALLDLDADSQSDASFGIGNDSELELEELDESDNSIIDEENLREGDVPSVEMNTSDNPDLQLDTKVTSRSHSSVTSTKTEKVPTEGNITLPDTSRSHASNKPSFEATPTKETETPRSLQSARSNHAVDLKPAVEIEESKSSAPNSSRVPALSSRSVQSIDKELQESKSSSARSTKSTIKEPQPNSARSTKSTTKEPQSNSARSTKSTTKEYQLNSARSTKSDTKEPQLSSARSTKSTTKEPQPSSARSTQSTTQELQPSSARSTKSTTNDASDTPEVAKEPTKLDNDKSIVEETPSNDEKQTPKDDATSSKNINESQVKDPAPKKSPSAKDIADMFEMEIAREEQRMKSFTRRLSSQAVKSDAKTTSLAEDAAIKEVDTHNEESPKSVTDQTSPKIEEEEEEEEEEKGEETSVSDHQGNESDDASKVTGPRPTKTITQSAFTEGTADPPSVETQEQSTDQTSTETVVKQPSTHETNSLSIVGESTKKKK